MSETSESSHIKSASNFGLGGPSTYWAYDAAAEEMDMDHVVWQPSQSNCAALNQLMSDANRPPNSPRKTRAKSWTPSPGSTSDTSSSSVSPLTATSSRERRPPRRRSSATSSESQTMPSSAAISGLSSNPSALLALIKDVSMKVDEDALLKRRAIERARMKAQAKKRGKDRDFVQKVVQGNNVTNGKERRRAEASDLRQPQGREGPAVDTAMDVDEDIQRMPPPTMIPTRRTHMSCSVIADLPPATPHLRKQGPTSAEALKVKDTTTTTTSALSFPMASANGFVDPSCHPSDDSDIRKAHWPSSLPKGSLGEESINNRFPASTCSSATSTTDFRSSDGRGCTSRDRLGHGSIPSATISTQPSTVSVRADSAPSASQIRLSEMSKSKNPPVLGMRRPGNSQPSSSQGFSGGVSAKVNLPVRQKQFRPPFAKTNSLPQRVPPLYPDLPPPAPRSATLPATCGEPGETAPALASIQRYATTTSVSTNSSRSAMSDRQAGSSSEDSHHPQSQHQNLKNIDGSGSSSPPPDADESFTSVDFDMGIDEDEIEKACSVYD